VVLRASRRRSKRLLGVRWTDSPTKHNDLVSGVLMVKKAFPVATPQDTESHFIGSGALGWEWWSAMEFTYSPSANPAPDDWSLTGIAGCDGEFPNEITLNHDFLLRAIRKIARMKVGEDYGNSYYVSKSVYQECKTWVFKGPDACDFDAPMADEVMQLAAFGVVTYV
jgi:hypothetical protein